MSQDPTYFEDEARTRWHTWVRKDSVVIANVTWPHYADDMISISIPIANAPRLAAAILAAVEKRQEPTP